MYRFNTRKTRNWVHWIELLTNLVITVMVLVGYFRNDHISISTALTLVLGWQNCALGVTFILVIFWHSHLRQLRALARAWSFFFLWLCMYNLRWPGCPGKCTFWS